MSIEIIDVEQGSPEWFSARLGLPTASRFADVMAKGEGKTRARYMRDLAGEIITGRMTEGISNANIERGKEMEPEARDLYAFARRVEVVEVGFIRNGNCGASPDGLIGDKGGIELKSAIPAIQIERMQRGTLPPENRAQVQGSLMVTEREWWDYVSYCAGMPPLIVRVQRDEAYIAEMRKAVDAFAEELDAVVQWIRTYENFKQVAAS